MDFYTQWWIVMGTIVIGIPLIVSMVAVAPIVWEKLVEWIGSFMGLLSKPFQPTPPVTTKAERNAKDHEEWQADFNRLAGPKHTYAAGCRCAPCTMKHTGVEPEEGWAPGYNCDPEPLTATVQDNVSKLAGIYRDHAEVIQEREKEINARKLTYTQLTALQDVLAPGAWRKLGDEWMNARIQSAIMEAHAEAVKPFATGGRIKIEPLYTRTVWTAEGEDKPLTKPVIKACDGGDDCPNSIDIMSFGTDAPRAVCGGHGHWEAV